MHFIFTAIGSHGDINPILTIAMEMRERGHDIDFVAHAYFAEKLANAGINHVILGDMDQYQRTVNDPDLWIPRKAFPAVWRVLRDGLEECYSAVRDRIVPGNTRLVGTTLAFGSRLVQEKLDIKMASIHLQPSVILSACDPMVIPGLPIPAWLPLPLRKLLMDNISRRVIDPVCKDDLNRFRAGLDLEPVEGILRTWCHSPDLVIGAFPDWFGRPQPDWPPNTVTTGFPLFNPGFEDLSPDLSNFLDNGPPPVVLTAGSAMAHSRAFFETGVEAIKKLGERAVFVSSFKNQLPESLPEEIFHAEYTPFGALLPRAAAVVHHGGIGTSAQSITAAAPQLIIPFAHDQFDNAARLERLGIALKADPHTPVRWTRALRRLMDDPSVKQKCRKFADKINDAPPAQKTIADHLEKL